MNNISHKRQILAYMQQNGSITPMEALREFGCYRLGARIWDLRRMGVPIKTEIVRGEVIVRINVLKQICARGKVKDVKDFIDDILESGEKLILFMNLIELGDAFKQLYPEAVVIRGGMSAADKQRSVDRFQTDPDCKLAICNIKAAGVGLTLTASSRVAFVEFPWTFADCEQCEDRAHRISQLNNVSCYYFLGKNTIDQDIYKIIQTKKNIAQTVTGTEDQVEESVVDALMDIFNQHK